MPDYQLSLAIGKEGQNARLAAKLTGFRIDIKSETQSAEEERARRDRRALEVAAPGDGSVEQEPQPAEPEASASA